MIRGADAAGADAVIVSDAQRRRLQPQGRPLDRRLAVPPAGRAPACPCPTIARRPCAARAAAARRGRRRARHLLHDADLTAPHAWVMGNEAWGLSRRSATPATTSCGCRSTASAESLNLAMAATVCLYASRHRRSRDRARTDVARLGLMAVRRPRHDRHGRRRIALGWDRRRRRPAPDGRRGRDATARSSSRQRGRPCQVLGQCDRASSLGTDVRDGPSRCTDNDGRRWWARTDPWNGLASRTGHREKLLSSPAGGEVLVTARYVRPGRSQPVDRGHRRPARRRGPPAGRAQPAPR